MLAANPGFLMIIIYHQNLPPSFHEHDDYGDDYNNNKPIDSIEEETRSGTHSS